MVVEVLNPQTAPDIEDALDDVALVLKIRYGDASFLIGGEASADAQSRCLRLVHGRWPGCLFCQSTARPSIRTFWMPFSRRLSSYRRTVPIYWGRRPDPDVIDMLPDVPMWRTDQHGTIHFTTDGVELYVSTER